MGSIDPHPFSPSPKDREVCRVCGMFQTRCELIYKPRDESSSRRPKGEVCQRFTGKREWGIGPAEPWRICVACGWPKAQHELPSCPAGLMLQGAFYACDLTTPHTGWAHSNAEIQAIWSENKDHAQLGIRRSSLDSSNQLDHYGHGCSFDPKTYQVYDAPGSDPRGQA